MFRDVMMAGQTACGGTAWQVIDPSITHKDTLPGTPVAGFHKNNSEQNHSFRFVRMLALASGVRAWR
jgi:hypothetical protein